MIGAVYLSGEAPKLSIGELYGALECLNSKAKPILETHPLVLLSENSLHGLSSRMGFCHFTGSLEIECKPEIKSIIQNVSDMFLDDKNKSFTWKVKCPGRTDLKPSSIFDELFREAKRKGITVNHRKADRKLFIIIQDKAYIGWITEENDRGHLLRRKGSRLPFSRPVMMDPRLTRTMVNLSGLQPGSKIIDPFLGPGGLAMEAARLGLKCEGVEIDPKIKEGADMNIKKMDLDDSINVHLGDSRDIGSVIGKNADIDYDGIITDPPFGRSASSVGEDPLRLVTKVLTQTREFLKPNSPVVIDISDAAYLGNLKGYYLEKTFRFRVHRSMTRHICLLRKQGN